MAWFLKFSSHLSNQKFVSHCSEAGEQCVLGGSQPSSLDGHIKMNGVYGCRRIHSHCCASHLHSTIRSPDGAPFHDGNQPAPRQGGPLGPTKMSSLEKTMVGLH